MNPPDEESLLPSINAKLQALAGAEHPWPEWYRTWLRLEAESTDAQRMAVCRAIRDSGDLPDDVGFSLVVWQINEISDRLAETRLRDLTDRMDALEDEYQSMHGRSWPDGEEPAEYTELFLEYDRACSEIFIECLHAFGENKMAEDFADDLTEFNRRYERGLEFFQLSDAPSLRMSDDLVKVASFANSTEADFARFALEAEGIPASFENANLVNWDWLLANAVQGVKLFVRKKDASRTMQVLQSLRRPTHLERGKYDCPSCGEPIPCAWDVCWRCGQDVTPSTTMLQDQANVGDRSLADSAGPMPVASETEAAVNDRVSVSPNARLMPVWESIAAVMLLFALVGLLAYVGEPKLAAFILAVAMPVIFIYQIALRSGSDRHEDTQV